MPNPPLAEDAAPAAPPTSEIGNQGFRRLRLLLRQPALPHYRIPVFRELARRPGIDLLVAAATSKGLPNVAADDFETVNMPFRMLPATPLGELYLDRELRRLQERKRFDVVIHPWNARQLDLRSSIAWQRKRGTASVVWGHGYSKQESAFRRWARDRSADAADAVLLYAEQAAASLRSRGVDPKKLFVAPNTMDASETSRAAAAHDRSAAGLMAARQAAGLENRPTVLHVSRLMAANRLDLLVEATSMLAREVPEVQIVVVGAGEEEKHRLLGLARNARVRARWHFLGAEYDPKRLGLLLAAAEVFCYPCNIGLSIVQALGAGLPVVTSNRFDLQNPEIYLLEDGRNGLLYEGLDPHAMAAQLTRIFVDGDLRLHLSAGALRSAETCSVNTMVDGMIASIRHAARSRRVRTSH